MADLPTLDDVPSFLDRRSHAEGDGSDTWAASRPPLRSDHSHAPVTLSPTPRRSAWRLVTAGGFGLLILVAAMFGLGRYVVDVRGPARDVGTQIVRTATFTMSNARVTASAGGRTVSGTTSMRGELRHDLSITSEDRMDLVVVHDWLETTTTFPGQLPYNEVERSPIEGGKVAFVGTGDRWTRELVDLPSTPERLGRMHALPPDSRTDYPERRVWPTRDWTVDVDKYCAAVAGRGTCSGTATVELDKFVRFNGERSAKLLTEMEIDVTMGWMTASLKLHGHIYRSLERYIDLEIDLVGTMNCEGMRLLPNGRAIETTIVGDVELVGRESIASAG